MSTLRTLDNWAKNRSSFDIYKANWRNAFAVLTQTRNIASLKLILIRMQEPDQWFQDIEQHTPEGVRIVLGTGHAPTIADVKQNMGWFYTQDPGGYLAFIEESLHLGHSCEVSIP